MMSRDAETSLATVRLRLEYLEQRLRRVPTSADAVYQQLRIAKAALGQAILFLEEERKQTDGHPLDQLQGRYDPLFGTRNGPAGPGNLPDSI